MAHEFWLDDKQWEAIEPHLPRGRRGAHRVDDRRVISGIVHVLRTGCRWRDCPSVFGPATTIYNRFRRWSLQGVWQNLLSALIQHDEPDVQVLDSTIVKAHRCAAGGKGGRKFRPSAARGAAERQSRGCAAQPGNERAANERHRFSFNALIIEVTRHHPSIKAYANRGVKEDSTI